MNMRLGFVSRLTIAFIASLLLAGAALAYTPEEVKEAEELLALARSRFLDGTATRAEVAEAEHHGLEMKFKAGLISRQDYCKEAIPMLQLIVSNLKAGDLGALIVAQRRLSKVKGLCR